jgi:polar amino acid transport system substrate-binding protein
MRRVGFGALALLLALLAAACGNTKVTVSGTGGTSTASTTSTSTTSASSKSCSKGDLNLVTPGQLTIGTDNPAYPPWYGGSAGHGWQVSDPYSGKGYESAVAYAVAKQLGFAKSEVKWTHVPFNTSFAPGKKSFDFDINQISYAPERASRSSSTRARRSRA